MHTRTTLVTGKAAGKLNTVSTSPEHQETELNALREENTRLKQLFVKAQTKIAYRLRRKNLNRRRTRFFVKYAKEFNPRLSALLFLLAHNTRSAYADGSRNQKCSWHCTAQWLGEQLGITKAAVYKLVHAARQYDLLDFDRTPRGMRLWLTNRRVYAELNKALNDVERATYPLGHYDLRLSRVLGINGSILYQFLKKAYEEDGADHTYAPAGLARCFPWMDEKSIRYELHTLHSCGYIGRAAAQWHVERGRIGWRYFWQPRKDRSLQREICEHTRSLLSGVQNSTNSVVATNNRILARNG